MKRLTISVLACTIMFASGTASARDEFDGSSNLICAAIDVVGCVDGANCTKGSARSFDLPDFMTVDFKKKF